MKRTLTLILTVLMLCTLLFGCGQKSVDGDPQDTNTEPALADGVYTADFSTDSSMFHVNEACEGKGTLTVENGQMTIHISLPSKSILNLFCGTAEDARKDGAALLQPTTDTVTYSDGLSEEVNGFDIPVPALDSSPDFESFMEELEAQSVGHCFSWGYFRRSAQLGPFDMFSDVDSRISHLNKIGQMVRLLCLANLLIGVTNTFSGASLAWLNLLCATFLAYGLGRISSKRESLVDERQLHE